MNLLNKLKVFDDQIYGKVSTYGDQSAEAKIRTVNAKKIYSSYLNEICNYHSVPVMDREVRIFLKNLPKNAVVLDVGGCWGWHWRHINLYRPDIKIVILDFVRHNLIHAKNLHSKNINKNIFLVNGDAKKLEFENDTFDAVWSVQVIQHIKDYKKVYQEVHRVLKKKGKFFDYNLNNSILRKAISLLFKKKYIIQGHHAVGGFYLRRSNQLQLIFLEKIFKNKCKQRYSEILFLPEIKLKITGRENSIIGKIDSFFSSGFYILKFIARQKSLHIVKK